MRQIFSYFQSTTKTIVLLITLTAGLTACGGGGGGGSGGDVTPASNIFVADSNNLAIGSQVDTAPPAGTFPVDRIIMGGNTLLGSSINALWLDINTDELYVANGTRILVFANAGTAEGDIAPARTLASVGAGNFTGFFMDTDNNRLYATDATAGLKVFENASIASNASPDRTVSGDFGGSHFLFGVSVDVSRDIAYVLRSSANSPAYAVNIFDNASTIDGSVTPDRTIVLGSQITDSSLFIDAANDRLYVSTAGGRIDVFESAGTLDGVVTPSKTVILPVPTRSRIIIDTANDRLYAAAGSRLYIIENVSSAMGAVAATAVIAPNAGDLTAVAIR